LKIYNMRINYTHKGYCMTMVYDKTAKKKATNLSINSDLLRQAKELNINLSSTFETSLEELIKEEKSKRWEEENKEFIEAYNKRIEEDGIFGEEHRCF
ncbi:MAG: type II toxin-antitoxin system CcdA family antitoxin, partial [Campylobacterota bacterium]|nr:type II toxin-antitoxin system CcdA family antitoxin [Campylobacterota bacterium]